MSQDVLSLIKDWDGNAVVTRYDRETGAWIFIALHDATLGRPTGGTRLKVYPELADALCDAQRLARGMTYKWAALGMEFGGGKAVIAPPGPLADGAREGLLLRYGDLVESLAGAFATGADLGTGPEAMAIIARRSRYVLGIDYSDGSSTDPGPFTALGVFCGMEAAVEAVFGSRELRDRTVLVEGVGGVGVPLARRLAEGGARLLLADLDTAKAAALAAELNVPSRGMRGELTAEAVPLADVHTTACDVYAPCAVGATLNPDTVAKLRCRIVAGSANNQLLRDDDAESLHERGIVYAPDYVINAGGALALPLLRDGVSRDEAFERVAKIGETVAEILSDAAEAGETPLKAARRFAERALDRARGTA